MTRLLASYGEDEIFGPFDGFAFTALEVAGRKFISVANSYAVPKIALGG